MTKTSKNITGAEAYYYIGRIQFNKKEYKEVQKTVTKLIGYEYSNDDWNNKGMLLLADAYLESGNDADAQVILQTLIENKPKQEYMDEAQKRLELLKLKQQKAEATRVEAQNKTMQINYQENKSEADLFDKAIEEIEKQKATNTNTNLPQPK
jgi:thioredoxin-like negative regulator of GroEL